MYILNRTLLFLFSSSMVFTTFAKTFQVHNITNTQLYAAVYERPFFSGSVVRKTEVSAIDPLGFAAIERPKHVMGASRKLTVAHAKDALPELLEKDVFDQLPYISIGTIGAHVFDSFYAVKKHNTLMLYDPVTLKISDIKQEILKNIETSFDAYRLSLAKNSALVTHNPYKDQDAHVRIGDQLCDQEKSYLEKRMPKVQKALEDFLGTELNGSYIPKIALINSGGGVRAMIASTGFHMGAQEIGLLDAVTYDVGLSGGSWFIALWLQSGLDIETFKIFLAQIVQQDLRLADTQEAKLFVDALLVRFGLYQPVTLVNSWGALLANRYLCMHEDKRQQVLWSDMATRIADGTVPFPIFAATSGMMAESFENRPKIPWFEITPFEVGGVGDWLGNAFVPMWAFGRNFQDGVSVDRSPEIDLGGIMGICGSAFAFSFSRGYEKVIKNLPVTGAMAHYLLSKIDTDTIGKKRITVSKIRNFSRGIAGSSVPDDRNVRMVDAGIAFNLPYPPVSGHGARKADVYVFFDASGHIERKGADNLRMIERYAKEHGLKFPSIDTKRLSQHSMSVFKDASDPEVPLVIYMPRIVAGDIVYPECVYPGFTTNFATTRFAYSEKDFNAFTAVTQTNIVSNKEPIIKELLAHIAQKGGIA